MGAGSPEATPTAAATAAAAASSRHLPPPRPSPVHMPPLSLVSPPDASPHDRTHAASATAAATAASAGAAADTAGVSLTPPLPPPPPRAWLRLFESRMPLAAPLLPAQIKLEIAEIGSGRAGGGAGLPGAGVGEAGEVGFTVGRGGPGLTVGQVLDSPSYPCMLSRAPGSHTLAPHHCLLHAIAPPESPAALQAV